MGINNEVYDKKGRAWWDDDGDSTLVSLRFLSNPVKFNYFRKIAHDKLKLDPNNNTVLDVGCGGGYLSEELARINLAVTGIDPSYQSVKSAKKHAVQENLNINYVEGFGENLPFESNSFDFICCCDVLEHVDGLETVLSEISRVLKNNGIFFYDTINRTLISKLIMIKILQEWKSTAFLDPNVHIWNMFIKPKELIKVMAEHKLINRDIKGLSPGMNFIAHYFNLRKRAKGKISWQDLSKKMKMHIDNNLSVNYVGYAEKMEPHGLRAPEHGAPRSIKSGEASARHSHHARVFI